MVERDERRGRGSSGDGARRRDRGRNARSGIARARRARREAEAVAGSVPSSRLPRFLSEPMWVLGLVILVDEIDKNIVRGMITPLKEEFGVGDFGIGLMLSLPSSSTV